VRLFFALWPPRETARLLSEWAREAQRRCGGRATAEESIHLTLAFLGDAHPARALAAARSVEAGAFELPVETACHWRHNKIVWAGPHSTPRALKMLVEALQLALFREQFILERRAFAAHVTLIRKVPDPAPLPELPPIRWPAPEFVLVRSTPANAGSRYETVQSFPLSAD
jgi:2'-5' RNA ligase